MMPESASRRSFQHGRGSRTLGVVTHNPMATDPARFGDEAHQSAPRPWLGGTHRPARVDRVLGRVAAAWGARCIQPHCGKARLCPGRGVAAAAGRGRRQGRARAIFSGVLLRRTVFLWAGFAFLNVSFYFANTWTPKLIADATGEAGLGVRAGVLIAVGGVLGALAFAALCLTVRPRLVTVALIYRGAMSFTLFANNFANAGLGLALAVAVGMFANGGLAAFYAISPTIYPAAVRGTGVGLMIGFGRGAAIIAPTFTGYLVKAGWVPDTVYLLFAGLLVVAGLATLLLDWTYRGHSEDPETPEAVASGALPAH